MSRGTGPGQTANAGLWRLRVEVDAESVEGVLELLAAVGCTGTWQRPVGAGPSGLVPPGDASSGVAAAQAFEGRVLVDAWFDASTLGDAQLPDRGPADLAQGLEALGASSPEWDRAEDRDWLEDYRRSARPLRVGDFELDPREPEAANQDAGGEPRLQRLLLPARRAFGTGSHETTRLVVEALQTLDLRGRTVLDVGTGTGVLAFVAKRLGAARVYGFDLDPVAALLAAENARLNAVSVQLFAGSVGTLTPEARFDLVLVNVLPENLRGAEPEIARHLGSGGDLLVSGVLSERAEAIEARWSELGLRAVGTRELGEWTLLRLRAAGARAVEAARW